MLKNIEKCWKILYNKICTKKVINEIGGILYV